MYNDFYNEDFLLEKKDENGKDNDDNLLSHGSSKKENPLYTDYKNQQIMSGKVVKSEKGWKKDEKRKERLKKVLAVGAGVATIAGGRHMIKMKNDPIYREKVKAKKNAAANSKAYHKEMKRQQKKMGHADAKANAAVEKIERKAANQKKIDDTLTSVGAKTTGAKGWFNKTFHTTFKESINLLLENYTVDELIYYISLEEGKKENKQKLINSYNKYVDKCLEKGKEPMTYKEYKEHKKNIKKNIKRAIALTAVASTAYADHRSVKSGKGHLTERIKYNRRNAQTDKYIRDQQNISNNVDRIRRNHYNPNINEELSLLESYNMDEYLYKLNNDVDFNKRSYHSYCVMMESKGLIPLEEDVFSDAKEKLASYSKAAIEGIKEEKRKKERKLEELEKKKAEEKKRKDEAEREMLKNMSPEQRKSYLKKKAKEEEEEEQKKQDKHDIKQTFKKGLASGSGEELGKSAVKIATKVFLR